MPSVIQSVERKASGMVIITAGGFVFSCDPAFFPLSGLDPSILKTGTVLDPVGAECLALAAQATEARGKALALLARAEQCRLLLSAKLARKDLEARAVKLALDRLETEGFLSDRRFTETWLRSRMGAANESPRHLLAALQAKGIDADVAREALKAVFGDEERADLLEKAARREGRRLDRIEGLKDSQRWAELKARLRAQGFRSEEIAAWFDSKSDEDEA